MAARAVCGITDVAPLAHEIYVLVQEQRFNEAKAKLPVERPWR